MRSKIPDSTLGRIEYHIWTGDLREHFTFRYWLEHWPKLVADLGSEINEDEFLRQQKVTTLTFGEEVVGIHLISEYQESDFASHPYFKAFSPTVISQLKSRGVRRLQALQYLMIDPRWSVMNTLMHFSGILGSLSLMHQVERGLDVSLTIARGDVPSAALAKLGGFEELETSVMHNVPVSYMACFNPKPHRKEEVVKWVDYYWKNRKVVHIEGTKRGSGS